VPTLLSVLMVVQAFTYREAPAGSVLHVRLTNAVGTFASHPGAEAEGVLIAPVQIEGDTVLPAGTLVHGRVKSVRRVGLGILHETASLDLIFDSITLPTGALLPVRTKVASVDNGREDVMPSGEIREGRSTASWGNHAAHLLRDAMLLDVHTQIAVWAVKSVVEEVPEPEIYLPTGAELTLVLSSPVRTLFARNTGDDSRGFTEDERASIEPVIEEVPERAFTPRTKKADTGRPADLVNVLLIGSREQISAAFIAAGWTEARPSSRRSNIGSAFAATFDRADHNAPMSSMRINNAPPDMAWEKGFNDVSKRHHIRVWKMAETWEGRQLWAAAATRDVEIGFLRPGHMVTHRVEEQVDHERDKIAWDLAYSSCADAMDWWERPAVPRSTRNSTGDRMQTDGQLVVVKVNDCQHPRGMIAAHDTLPMHGGRFQRILRREILGARSDLIRDNIYWRAYEGVRILVSSIQSHRRTPEPDAAPRSTLASRLQPAGLTSVVSFR
jgi:hypothetical protein